MALHFEIETNAGPVLNKAGEVATWEFQSVAMRDMIDNNEYPDVFSLEYARCWYVNNGKRTKIAWTLTLRL